MKVLDAFPLWLGLLLLTFSIGLYVRRRIKVSGTVRRSEPLVEDGWLTFPDEAEYEQLRAKLQNEAFGDFCRQGIYALMLVAAGFGMNLSHDVFGFLVHLK